MTFKPAPPTQGLKKIKSSDKEEVEKAEAYLLFLLRDPHYYEAYVRLNKAGKLPGMPNGSIPIEPGKLAAKLAKPDSPKTKRGPGAPKKDKENSWGFILDYAENNKMKLIEVSRKAADKACPTDSNEQREKLAQGIAQIIRDLKKTRGKN